MGCAGVERPHLACRPHSVPLPFLLLRVPLLGFNNHFFAFRSIFCTAQYTLSSNNLTQPPGSIFSAINGMKMSVLRMVSSTHLNLYLFMNQLGLLYQKSHTRGDLKTPLIGVEAEKLQLRCQWIWCLMRVFLACLPMSKSKWQCSISPSL